jgi:hypothetical protein
MIRKDLLDFQYYLNRLSMFMKESYGITEQVEIFYQQLKRVNEEYDYFFDQLDIFNVQNKELPSNYVSSLIDKVAAIFGCYRHFTINLEGTDIDINLTNEDFITYIKCQIVKQNFDGTREQLKRIYTTIEEKETIKSEDSLDLILVYMLNPTPENTLQCTIYWVNFTDYSENLQKLFLAGYLTIESMGVLYNRLLQNIDTLSVFADVGETYADSFYYFAGQDKDYFFVESESKYYQWHISDGQWDATSSEPSEGRFWGNLATEADLPTNMEGGYFA